MVLVVYIILLSLVTLSGKSSLTLGENKAAFRRERHIILVSQIKVLFNDVNHDIIANQYSFCGIREHKNTFSHYYSSCEDIFYLCLSLNLIKCRKLFVKNNLNLPVFCHKIRTRP